MQITTINTIELSSLCDNRCEYCPAPIQGKHRKTGLMRRDVFEKAIAWVKHFCNRGTQRELNLFGVGEPCLHPHVVDYVEYARNNLPFRQDLHLNTNGNKMTKELAIKLKKVGITAIDITAHKARAAAETVRIFREVGIPFRVSMDFMLKPNNWAGQVDWLQPDYFKIPDPGNVCPWLARGQVMVMSDGNITNCCIDAFAQGVFGTIDDDLDQLEVKTMPLCRSCHHLTPDEFTVIYNNRYSGLSNLGQPAILTR